MSYTELVRKYHLDPRTAKKYAESESRPVYSLSGVKRSKLEGVPHHVDCVHALPNHKRESMEKMNQYYNAIQRQPEVFIADAKAKDDELDEAV